MAATTAQTALIANALASTATGALPSGMTVPQAAPPAFTAVVLGDSITGRYQNGGDLTHLKGDNGYWTHALRHLKQQLFTLKNAGVSGETTTQMLARISTSVVAYAPGWCVVEGGINDVQANASASTIQSNLTTIFNTLINAGIRPVATTITPLSGGTASQLNTLYRVNQWLKDYCQFNRGILLCDWTSYVADPATGAWYTGYSTDNVHPTVIAATLMGKVLADTINNALPYTIDICPQSEIDPDNLLTNGMFSGSVSGLATNWTLTNGGGATVATTKVARTDGIPGEWQQVAVTVAGTAAVTITNKNTAVNTDWVVGDKVWGWCEYEVDAGASMAHWLGVGEERGTGVGSADPFGNNSSTPYGTYATRGVMRTFPFTTDTGAVRLAFQLNVRGTGTIRYGRAKLAKYTGTYPGF